MRPHFEKVVTIIVIVAVAFSVISAMSNVNSGQGSTIITGAASSGDNVIAEGCWLGVNMCSGASYTFCLSSPNCRWSAGRCSYDGEDCRTVDRNDCSPGLIGACMWYECIDNDRDGAVYAHSSSSLQYCTSRTGLNKPKDCDDGDPAVRACKPGQTPKASLPCTDADRDDYGKIGTSLMSCKYKLSDCDEERDQINPGAKEVCNNNLDDNCNGLIDLKDGDCITFCVDKDNDGYGAAGTVTNECRIPNPVDCDDSDRYINAGQNEIAHNGKDDDCDARTKDDDFDGDGFNIANDCNDKDLNIYPGAKEVCDGQANDCNKQQDWGVAEQKLCNYQNNCGNWGTACTDAQVCGKKADGIYACAAPVRCIDIDGDGYGTGTDLSQCYDYDDSRTKADCNDNDPAIHPGQEFCSNSKDDNCNGQIDEVGCINKGNTCTDDDGDGAPKQGTELAVCTLKNYDCDDSTPNRSPYATETCDGIDNNCNGAVDEGLGTHQGTDSFGPGQTYASLAGTQTKTQGVCQSAMVSCMIGKWQWDYFAGAAQRGWTYEKEEGQTNSAYCGDGFDNDCDGKLDCAGESSNNICDDYCAQQAAQIAGQTGGSQGQGGTSGSSGCAGEGCPTGGAVTIAPSTFWDALLEWLYGR